MDDISKDLEVLEKLRHKRDSQDEVSLTIAGNHADPIYAIPQEVVARAFERQPGKDRLTVVENVYHQPASGNATGIESAWDRWLESDAQPYARKLKVGQDWKPISYGWLDEDEVALSQLCIRNVSEDKDLCILLGVGERGEEITPFANVRLGQSSRFEPFQRIWIKCQTLDDTEVSQGGRGLCLITAFPE